MTGLRTTINALFDYKWLYLWANYTIFPADRMWMMLAVGPEPFFFSYRNNIFILLYMWCINCRLHSAYSRALDGHSIKFCACFLFFQAFVYICHGVSFFLGDTAFTWGGKKVDKYLLCKWWWADKTRSASLLSDAINYGIGCHVECFHSPACLPDVECWTQTRRIGQMAFNDRLKVAEWLTCVTICLWRNQLNDSGRSELNQRFVWCAYAVFISRPRARRLIIDNYVFYYSLFVQCFLCR